LIDLQNRGLAFELKTYEIHAPENWQLLFRLLAVYGAEVGPVPILFVGDIAVVYETFYGLGPTPQRFSGLAYQMVLEEVIQQAIEKKVPSPIPSPTAGRWSSRSAKRWSAVSPKGAPHPWSAFLRKKRGS
jgi:hypothetical protein